MKISYGVLAAFCLLLLGAAEGETQNVHPSHGITIMGGSFADERGEGQHPFLSGRYERWFSRVVAFEGGITHARGQRLLLSSSTLNERTVSTSHTSGDLGIQMQIPFAHVRPYVGATIGGTYFDGSEFRGSDAGVTHAILGGLRIGRLRDVSLRTELRLRRDDIARDVSYNAEYGLGITYSW
ncbi:MAG: hypothetical protein M3403_07445 [Gemmatimonadota bacterium]|nr:hypothetical protein [Gemmatimonadota bacterium]